MFVGNRVRTSLGDCLILESDDLFLILFSLENSKFVKANGYEMLNGKLVWNQGEYYDSLSELARNMD